MNLSINKLLYTRANPFLSFNQHRFKVRQYSSDELVGTVNYHLQHLGLITKKQSWPVKFFDTSAFHLNIFKQIKEKSPELFSSIKLTNIYCSSLSSASNDEKDFDSKGIDIVLFPLGLNFCKINNGNLPSFIDFLTKFSFKEYSSTEALAWINKETQLSVSLIKNKYHLVVCTHNEVDCRCGKKGNDIYNELVELSREDSEFLPFRSSHLGGHKYAGNVIVYPRGDWYGNIDTENLSTLIEHIKQDKIWQQNWRGRIGMDKETQLKYLEES